MRCEKNVVREIFSGLDEINKLKKDVKGLYKERNRLVYETLKKKLPENYEFEIKCCIRLVKENGMVYIKHYGKKYNIEEIEENKDKLNPEIINGWEYIIEHPCKVIKKIQEEIKTHTNRLKSRKNDLKRTIKELYEILKEINEIE